MGKTATTPWDPAAHLETEEDMAAYLEAALEDGDPALVAAALGDIARAKGMTQVAREAGLGRESLYKALSPSGNPELATILRWSRPSAFDFTPLLQRSRARRDERAVGDHTQSTFCRYRFPLTA